MKLLLLIPAAIVAIIVAIVGYISLMLTLSFFAAVWEEFFPYTPDLTRDTSRNEADQEAVNVMWEQALREQV